MLNPVAADKIEPLWDWVRQGLLDARDKCRAEWEPEEIRQALVLNQAQLYTWGQDEGFCVLQRHTLRGTPVLFIWALWGPGQYEDYQEAIWRDLDAIAKGIGAARIRWQGRGGWAKHAKRVDTIFEREVW